MHSCQNLGRRIILGAVSEAFRSAIINLRIYARDCPSVRVRVRVYLAEQTQWLSVWRRKGEKNGKEIFGHVRTQRRRLGLSRNRVENCTQHRCSYCCACIDHYHCIPEFNGADLREEANPWRTQPIHRINHPCSAPATWFGDCTHALVSDPRRNDLADGKDNLNPQLRQDRRYWKMKTYYFFLHKKQEATARRSVLPVFCALPVNTYLTAARRTKKRN